MGYGVSGAYLTVKELDTMKSLTHKMYPQIFFYDEAHLICDDDLPSDVLRDVRMMNLSRWYGRLMMLLGILFKHTEDSS